MSQGKFLRFQNKLLTRVGPLQWLAEVNWGSELNATTTGSVPYGPCHSATQTRGGQDGSRGGILAVNRLLGENISAVEKETDAHYGLQGYGYRAAAEAMFPF